MATMAPKKQAEQAPADPLAGLSDDNANQFVQDLLEDADGLSKEKYALLERIDDNRQTLRRIARTGHLSEKQAAAIKMWYPERQKKEEGEETATDTKNGAAA
jgi:uncharacterized protein (DUF2225 family)